MIFTFGHWNGWGTVFTSAHSFQASRNACGNDVKQKCAYEVIIYSIQFDKASKARQFKKGAKASLLNFANWISKITNTPFFFATC